MAKKSAAAKLGVKMKKATSKDWKIKPLPKKRSLIPADRHFTLAEMNRIKRGVIPLEMEEKWFIFFKRNRLYFHRSWTGYCVFVAHFKRRQGGYVLHLIEANRNARQYSETEDAYDAKLFFYILDLLLLGRETPFPSKAGVSPDVVPIQQWSQVGKAMLSESKSGSKGPAGFIAALDQASKPNYLGDPEVVGKLLREFSSAAMQRRKDGEDPEEAEICDYDHAQKMADIFLGKASDYAPIIPWNSPGHIDKWLINEIYYFEIAGETPDLTVFNAMMCYLKEIYNLAEYVTHDSKSDEWMDHEINKITAHYIHLLLGIPYKDPDEPDENSEDP